MLIFFFLSTDFVGLCSKDVVEYPREKEEEKERERERERDRERERKRERERERVRFRLSRKHDLSCEFPVENSSSHSWQSRTVYFGWLYFSIKARLFCGSAEVAVGMCSSRLRRV